MRKKQTNPQKLKRYRSKYSKEDMKDAYKAVAEKNFSVRKASRMFGIPRQTLRDRFNGVTHDYQCDMGAKLVLTSEEERTLVEHAEVMSQMGYSYTNVQLRYLAGELAYSLERRKVNQPLSNNWVYGLLKRWKLRLASLNLRSPKAIRAKASSPEVIDHYYKELNSVLQKYNLADKPQFIYNVDETCLIPNHRPPNVKATPESEPQAITLPTSTTVTMVGCANAAGNSVPPFFIFKGKRFMPELLNGASAGVKGKMSDSGWINGTIFKEYLSDHFLPFARLGNTTSSQHILLMYDGHRSHVSTPLIKWAEQNNIILFVLPAHTSQLLKPLDAAIFTPFKSYYHSECSLFMKRNIGEITRYNMCSIACKAYLKAMTPTNIQSAFRETGIHPYCRQTIPDDKLHPAEGFREKDPVQKLIAMKTGKDDWIMKKNVNVEEKLKVRKKAVKRPNPGGLAITEEDFANKMIEYDESREQNGKKVKKDSTPPNPSKPEKIKNIKTKSNKQNNQKNQSPQPSTSGLQVHVIDTSSNNDSDSEGDISYNNDSDSEGDISYNNDSDIDGDYSAEVQESDKCCVCKEMFPPAARAFDDETLINWAQCDKCDQWVHLRFCSPKTFVRKHGEFLCIHCDN